MLIFTEQNACTHKLPSSSHLVLFNVLDFEHIHVSQVCYMFLASAHLCSRGWWWPFSVSELPFACVSFYYCAVHADSATSCSAVVGSASQDIHTSILTCCLHMKL